MSVKKIPDHVEMDRVPEPKERFTPENVMSEVEKLPTPTGYRLLVLPFSQKAVTKGGIHLSDSYLEKERLATNVGFIISLGDDAYKDEVKFPNGPWCAEGDWIIFGRYAGARIKIDGGDLRLLNDDEVLAVIGEPEDVSQ